MIRNSKFNIIQRAIILYKGVNVIRPLKPAVLYELLNYE